MKSPRQTSSQPASYEGECMLVYRKQFCFREAVFCIGVSSRGCYMFFKSPETLIESKIETCYFFPPTKSTLQGKSRNKGLRRCVEYDGNILRADEQVGNLMTKNTQGRNLMIVRPRLRFVYHKSQGKTQG